MPLGSSSAAPVMRPGPSRRNHDRKSGACLDSFTRPPWLRSNIPVDGIVCWSIRISRPVIQWPWPLDSKSPSPSSAKFQWSRSERRRGSGLRLPYTRSALPITAPGAASVVHDLGTPYHCGSDKAAHTTMSAPAHCRSSFMLTWFDGCQRRHDPPRRPRSRHNRAETLQLVGCRGRNWDAPKLREKFPENTTARYAVTFWQGM